MTEGPIRHRMIECGIVVIVVIGYLGILVITEVIWHRPGCLECGARLGNRRKRRSPVERRWSNQQDSRRGVLGVLGKMRMTYTIDKHSAVDGGRNCRAIFGIAFRAGERVVIALVK